jgi:hypothetical protein
MQHAADGGGQPVVVGAGRTLVEPSLPAQPGPAAAASPVDVVEIEPGLVEEVAEGAVTQLPQLGDQATPVDP